MRKVLSSVVMRGTIVIGQGTKDKAPMLFTGEDVGDGTGPEYDVAVLGAVMAVRAGTGVDLLLGIGGASEAVISPCAVKVLGAVQLARPAPYDAQERAQMRESGLDVDAVLTATDLVRAQDVFFVATGITDGELLRGTRYGAGTASTNSLVMRGRTGTVRSVEAEHRLDLLSVFSSVDYTPWLHDPKEDV